MTNSLNELPVMANSSRARLNAGRLPCGVWTTDPAPINVRRIFYGDFKWSDCEQGLDGTLGPFARPAGMNPPTIRDLACGETDRNPDSGAYRARFTYTGCEALTADQGDSVVELLVQQARSSVFFPDRLGAMDVLNAIRQAFHSWLCGAPERVFATYWSGSASVGGGLTVFGYLDRYGRILWARPFDAMLESEGLSEGQSVEVAADEPGPGRGRSRRRT